MRGTYKTLLKSLHRRRLVLAGDSRLFDLRVLYITSFDVSNQFDKFNKGDIMPRKKADNERDLKMVTLGVKVTKSWHDEIKKLAGPFSLSDIIRALLKAWLDGDIKVVWEDGEVKVKVTAS